MCQIKRYLFFLICTFITCTDACAQSRTPDWLLTDSVMYLYNTDWNGYLVGANSYSTQASLSKANALKVRILKWYGEDNAKSDSTVAGNSDVASWDGETIMIEDSVENGDYLGQWCKMFREGNDNIFVNQAYNTENNPNLWTIKPSNDKTGTFTISLSRKNACFEEGLTSYKEGRFLGVRKSDKSDTPALELVPAKGNCIRWKLVPLDKFAPELVRVKEDLQKLMDYARKYCHDENVGRAISACNPATGTYDDLLHQKANLRHSLIMSGEYRNLNVSEIIDGLDSIPAGIPLYLYNIERGKFMVGDNSWSTQASVSADKILKVRFVKYEDKKKGIAWDGQTYYIEDEQPDNWRKFFIAGNNDIYIDQDTWNEKADNLWLVRPSSKRQGAFTISPSPLNKINNAAGVYLGVPKNNAKEVPEVYLVTDEDDAIEWAVGMNPDVYVFVDLRKYTVDAAGDVDYTSLIRDYDIDKGVNFADMQKGWKVSWTPENNGTFAWREGLITNTCVHAEENTFEMYQEVLGVPDGLYRLDVQAFTRPRTYELAWFERDTSYIVPYFFANEIHCPVHNIFDCALMDDGSADIYKREQGDGSFGYTYQDEMVRYELDGRYIPNNVNGASVAFDNGLYDNSLYCYVNSGKIKLGICQDYYTNGTWTAWDNFRLTYVGDSPAAYHRALTEYLKSVDATLALCKVKDVDTLDIKFCVNRVKSMLDSDDVPVLRSVLSELNSKHKLLRMQLRHLEEADPLKEVYDPLTIGSKISVEDLLEGIESMSENEVIDVAAPLLNSGKAADAFSVLDKGISALESRGESISTVYKLKGTCYRLMMKEEKDSLNKRKLAEKGLECYRKYIDSYNMLQDEKTTNSAIVFANFWMGRIYVAIGEVQKAYELILTTQVNDEDIPSKYSWLCHLAMLLDRYNEALDFADKLIELDYAWYSYHCKAEALIKLERYQEALEVWNIIMDKEPSYIYHSGKEVFKALKGQGLLE